MASLHEWLSNLERELWCVMKKIETRNPSPSRNNACGLIQAPNSSEAKFLMLNMRKIITLSSKQGYCKNQVRLHINTHMHTHACAWI